MPTNHRRIAVTNDPELANALERVRRYFDGVPTARMVHDLAIKGAEVLEQEEQRRAEAIERLIEWSTTRSGPIDWDYLIESHERAWGD